MQSIGGIIADFGNMPYLERFKRAEESDVRCPDSVAAEKIHARIEEIIHKKDTLGGVLEVVVLNVPGGLGSFAQWDRRLDARLGTAVLSVQAIKGVEIGDAFENANLPGTQAHDVIMLSTENGIEDRRLYDLMRPTNRAGGIEGGISNGQPIIIRAAMKPIATTLTPQTTVDLATGKESPTNYERSDFCPVPRAVPVIEAMVGFVLADVLIEKIGGDSIVEMKSRFPLLRKSRLEDLQMDNRDHVWWNE